MIPSPSTKPGGVRAKPDHPAHGHGRTDAVFPGLIGARGDHAAFVRPAADDDRFAPVFRVVALFHGGEKGVQVAEEDVAIRGMKITGSKGS